jgi:NADH-quinone oxidoreductase subunit E
MTQELVVSDFKSAVLDALRHHGNDHEALIPILLELNEKFGYLPTQVLVELSHGLQLPLSRIYSVASFYTMLATEPHGRHVIQFCESAPCHIMGGQSLYTALVELLNLQPGQTSFDSKWTLVLTSCIGACGVGPLLVIDDKLFGSLNIAQLPEILSQYD